MAEKLKPCPFCGGATPRAVESLARRDSYFITCSDDDCASTGAYRESEEEAIEAWNRRVVEDDCGQMSITLDRDDWVSLGKELTANLGKMVDIMPVALLLESLTQSGIQTSELDGKIKKSR